MPLSHRVEYAADRGKIVMWIALYIFLGFLLLLAVILLARVRVSLKYDKQLILSVRMLGLTVFSTAKKEKPKKEKPKKVSEKPPKAEQKTDKPKQDKPEEKKKAKVTLDKVFTLVKMAADATGAVLKRLKIKRLHLDIVIASPDAFNTAMMFGGAGAAYGWFAVIRQKFKIQDEKIAINVDFDKTEPEIYCDLVIQTRICYMLVIGLKYGFKIRKVLKG